MTVEVQDPGDLVAWGLSKTCAGWRKDRGCGHPGCMQAQRATEMLRELKPVGSSGLWALDEADVHFST